MATHYMKQGDRHAYLRATLSDRDGAVNLTGASVRFIMTSAAGTELVNEAATIVTAASGIVEYRWADGDTDTVGSHKAEFEVTFSDDRVGTFPNEEEIIVSIRADLGDAP